MKVIKYHTPCPTQNAPPSHAIHQHLPLHDPHPSLLHTSHLTLVLWSLCCAGTPLVVGVSGCEASDVERVSVPAGRRVPAVVRYGALCFLSLWTLGGYVSHDSVASMQDSLMRALHISNTQYSLLFAAFDWSNCALAVISGFVELYFSFLHSFVLCFIHHYHSTFYQFFADCWLTRHPLVFVGYCSVDWLLLVSSFSLWVYKQETSLSWYSQEDSLEHLVELSLLRIQLACMFFSFFSFFIFLSF